jgi:hypothetical protein
MRQLGFKPLLGILMLCLATGAPGQEPTLPPGGGPAAAVAAEIDVERTLLAEDLERYDRLVSKRDLLASRLAEIYRTLDAAVRSGVGATPEQVDALLEQLGRTEAERDELLSQETNLVETIRDRRRRIVLLLEQVELLEGRERQEAGALTGTWDVVLMPLEQHGLFALRQAGTLVSGTYELDGGWTGSLQGTLVNRKVFLVRIDSKLGRMMELEGFLSGEETVIRGTWLNYELAGGEGASGHWSARKRESEP